MAPSDMNNDYKVRSFQHLYSGYGYNSLGSTCTCHYLIVGSNVFHNGSSSKLNFRFAAEITLLGEVNRIVTRLITRGDVVLRLQGLGLCDLKPDQCVALRTNRCLS
jgi:hypothetical protein